MFSRGVSPTPTLRPSRRGLSSRTSSQQGPTTLLVLFKSATLDARSEEFQAAEKKALDGLTAAQIPHLQSIQTYANTGSAQLVSKDGKSSVAVLNFTASLQTIQNRGGPDPGGARRHRA